MRRLAPRLWRPVRAIAMDYVPASSLAACIPRRPSLSPRERNRNVVRHCGSCAHVSCDDGAPRPAMPAPRPAACSTAPTPSAYISWPSTGGAKAAKKSAAAAPRGGCCRNHIQYWSLAGSPGAVLTGPLRPCCPPAARWTAGCCQRKSAAGCAAAAALGPGAPAHPSAGKRSGRWPPTDKRTESREWC